MRIGMSLNYAGGFAETVEELADYEKAGLEIVFVPEAYSFDAVSQLGFIAAKTQRLPQLQLDLRKSCFQVRILLWEKGASARALRYAAQRVFVNSLALAVADPDRIDHRFRGDRAVNRFTSFQAAAGVVSIRQQNNRAPSLASAPGQHFAGGDRDGVPDRCRAFTRVEDAWA